MDLRSNYPFWLVKNGLPYAYPTLENDLACDVAVIGGGITGALVAHALVEAGFATIVLDKREIGWGSTSASTALLQYEIDTPLQDLIQLVGEDHAVRSYHACRTAIDTLERLAQSLDVPCGFERKKSLYLASCPRDAKALYEEFELRQKFGFKLDWLDEDAITTLFGFRRPAALLSYDAAQMDTYRFTHGLLQKAKRAGLQIYDRTEVVKLKQAANSIELFTDRACCVRAHRVVFATGYETQQYLKQQPAKLISTYALVSEPLEMPSAWYEQCLIWESARPYFYLRTTPDGRIMMGGEDEDFRDPARRDRLLKRKTATLQTKFQELFPQTPLEVAFAWAGTFGETKDGLAYIGATDEFPNAYFALGYGGNGITFSAIAADIIRDSLLGRHNPNAELFRFDR